jgi:uncharacterized Fe-S cluster protein YjdI
MKTYTKEDIKIVWQSEKCTHSAKCALGLPKVFKPKEKPWIKAENASNQDIIDQVAKCPSGALSIIH